MDENSQEKLNPLLHAHRLELEKALENFKQLKFKLKVIHKYAGAPDISVELILLRENTVILDVPIGIAQEGEEIVFEIWNESEKADAPINWFKVRAKEIHDVESGRAALVCSFAESEREKLQKLIQAVQKRRSELSSFFNQARGLV